MSRTYAISRYLSPQSRRAAVRATYDCLEGGSLRVMRRRTEDGYCPLGIAVRAETGEVEQAPTSDRVAFALIEHGATNLRQIERAASTFIVAWDEGRIKDTDLPKALGVTPEGGDA